SASASLFCLKASSGYLSLAAARAGLNDSVPNSATAPAPCRIRRRVGDWQGLMGGLRKLQRLQEIDDRVDFLLGENAVAPERGHHGLRIARGLVGDDGDEILAI